MNKEIGRLELIQNVGHKFITLIMFNFLPSSLDEMKKHISHCYNCMKTKMILLQARMQDIGNTLKMKSPALLSKLNKSLHKIVNSDQKSMVV